MDIMQNLFTNVQRIKKEQHTLKEELNKVCQGNTKVKENTKQRRHRRIKGEAKKFEKENSMNNIIVTGLKMGIERG